MRFRRQYDEVAQAAVGRACVASCVGPSLVKESFTDDANINVLVKRFGIDKDPIPPAVFDPAYYGLTDDVFDLRTAMERIRVAKERFLALPARVRERFANDPANLAEFVLDESNRDEAQKLGLLKPVPAPDAPAVTPPG